MGRPIVRGDRGEVVVVELVEVYKQFGQVTVQILVDLLVRADLGGHLKYSRHWSGVRAGVLLGAQGAVRRGENRGGL